MPLALARMRPSEVPDDEGSFELREGTKHIQEQLAVGRGGVERWRIKHP